MQITETHQVQMYTWNSSFNRFSFTKKNLKILSIYLSESTTIKSHEKAADPRARSALNPGTISSRMMSNLNKLWAGQLKESRLGLSRASSSHQGLSCAWRSVEQDTLGRLDADVLELLLVGHGQHDSLDQLLDLLVQTTDVRILLRGPENQHPTIEKPMIAP